MYVPRNNYHVNLEELLKRTGYQIIHENGQRVYCNPLATATNNNQQSNNQPPRGCEIFVGRLPRDVYEDALVPVFERVGVIHKLRLMMDFNGKNRGFCFVTYYSKEVANAAVELFDGFEIRAGCKIGVFKSLDNTRLFVGGIPVDKTKDEVNAAFREFVEGIQDVIMYPSNTNQNVNRGYVFIEFENHRFAAIARRRLQPGSLILWESPILVDWAEPLPDPDPLLMAKVTKLYCRNICITMTQATFNYELAKYISMQFVHKIHKQNDFAFIHFVNRATAEAGLKSLTGIEIEGRKLEVMWARPVIYSNTNQRIMEPNHFCLSIPAKIRRLIRMRQKAKQACESRALVPNHFNYPTNHPQIPMGMQMPPGLLPHPCTYQPNFMLHFNENGILI